MKNIITASLGLALLSGCITNSAIYRDMEPVIGKKLDDVITTIGLPNAEQRIAGRMVYVWSTEAKIVIPVVNTTQVDGMIGHTDYSATASSIGYQQTTVGCVLKLSVDRYMRVTQWQMDGHKNRCAWYSRRLAKLAQRSNY